MPEEYTGRHRDPEDRRASKKTKAEVNHDQQGDGLGKYGHVKQKNPKEKD